MVMGNTSAALESTDIAVASAPPSARVDRLRSAPPGSARTTLRQRAAGSPMEHWVSAVAKSSKTMVGTHIRVER